MSSGVLNRPDSSTRFQSLCSSRGSSQSTEITFGVSGSSHKTPAFLQNALSKDTSAKEDGAARPVVSDDADEIALQQAEKLRAELRDIIDCRSNRGVSEVYQRRLLQLLLTRARNKSVWLDALRCFCGDQDVPLVECTKLGQHSMIEWILTDLSLSKEENRMLLEHPGQYGRNAVQHGVRLKQWSCVNMLIRHGANIGYTCDKLGIVDSIVRSAAQQKLESGSWRDMDKPLTEVFATCCFLYGEKWATDKPRSFGRYFDEESPRRGLRYGSHPSRRMSPTLSKVSNSAPLSPNRERRGSSSSAVASAAARCPLPISYSRESSNPYRSDTSSRRHSISTVPFPAPGSVLSQDTCASARQSIHSITTQPFPGPGSGSPSVRLEDSCPTSPRHVLRGWSHRQGSGPLTAASGSSVVFDRPSTPVDSHGIGLFRSHMRQQQRRNTM